MVHDRQDARVPLKPAETKPGRKGPATILLGIALVLIGIPMLVCPGPGLATIAAGLAMLGIGASRRRHPFGGGPR